MAEVYVGIKFSRKTRDTAKGKTFSMDIVPTNMFKCTVIVISMT